MHVIRDVIIVDGVTSIKVDSKIWKKVKILGNRGRSNRAGI